MEEKKNMQNITIIAQARHVELYGTATPGHTIAAADEYIVPVDPAGETQWDSCQGTSLAIPLAAGRRRQ